MKSFSVKSIVATGIGAALFFVLGRFVIIPSPVPNTNINLQYGLLAFLSAVYGPAVGLLSGLIGHVLVDLTSYGLWWSWEIATGLFGLAMGFLTRKLTLEDGEFSKHDAIKFTVSHILCHLAAWVVIAPALDVLIYQEPTDKIIVQGLVAATSNIITTAIVGTLLLFAYAAAKPKKGSLKKEK